MHTERSGSIAGSRARSTVAVLLAVWVLFLSVLAFTPWLHNHFHATKDQPGCALCLFVKGQMTAEPAMPVLQVIPALVLFALIPAASQALASVDYRFSPSRAPPAGISSITVVG